MQFSITFDGQPFLPALSGSDGLAIPFDVSGANGNVVGVDLSGQGKVPVIPGPSLLTKLETNGGEPFPPGEVCIILPILSDSNAMEVLP